MEQMIKCLLANMDDNQTKVNANLKKIKEEMMERQEV
jgi:hypothetical protein